MARWSRALGGTDARRTFVTESEGASSALSLTKVNEHDHDFRRRKYSPSLLPQRIRAQLSRPTCGPTPTQVLALLDFFSNQQDKAPMTKSPPEIKRLSDDELLKETDRLVRLETLTTTAILYHLQEIDVRKLYAEKNCDSLFTYCTRILKYSESQAHRRITAARLLGQIPDLDRKIQEGKLTLTNIAQAHSFFLFEKRAGRALTPERKSEILHRLEDKSTRDAERILVAEHPNDRPLNRESIRFITENAIEIKMIVNPELLQKLSKIKVLSGHKLPEANWADVIGMLCDDALERLDPMKKAARAAKRAEEKSSRASYPHPPRPTFRNKEFEMPFHQEDVSSLHFSRQPVPAAIRHQVWIRDSGCCSHIDLQTGQRCASQLRLEIDHVRPVAAGGGNEVSNLRLLCRAHNQRRNVAPRAAKYEPP